MATQLFHVGIKALCQNKDGKYLLLQVNPEHLHNQGSSYWDIPGGRIEDSDSVESTLKREVKEELGIEINGKTEFFTGVVSNIKIPTSDGEVGLVLMIYIVNLPEDVKIKISEEHLKYEWVEPAEAAKRLTYKYPEEFTEKLK